MDKLTKKGIHLRSHELMIASTTLALVFSGVTADMRDYSKIQEVTVI